MAGGGGGWWWGVGGGGGGWMWVGSTEECGNREFGLFRKNCFFEFFVLVFSRFLCFCLFFFVCLSSGRKVVELFAVSFHSRGYDLAGPVNYATCSIGWC